uniref:Uncharacterized protein n=1 Tax=Rhizophora mucronata TaxID=61149 RepID=A0A2P2P204_RHIMU
MQSAQRGTRKQKQSMTTISLKLVLSPIV